MDFLENPGRENSPWPGERSVNGMPTFQRFPQPFNFPSHWTGRGFKSKHLLMASYPHKTKKAGHQRPSAPPASRYSLVFKAFSYAKLKSPQPIVSSTEDFRGAGGGTRTHMPLLTTDFESVSYANFDTPANIKLSWVFPPKMTDRLSSQRWNVREIA